VALFRAFCILIERIKPVIEAYTSVPRWMQNRNKRGHCWYTRLVVILVWKNHEKVSISMFQSSSKATLLLETQIRLKLVENERKRPVGQCRPPKWLQRQMPKLPPSETGESDTDDLARAVALQRNTRVTHPKWLSIARNVYLLLIYTSRYIGGWHREIINIKK